MIESPLAEYDAKIAALHEQMKPLRDQVSALNAERREYADLVAEDTDDPQMLSVLREDSQVAYREFDQHVRTTTHEGIIGFNSWLPISEDYSTGYLTGPHLGVSKDADADYVQALAESMVDFAARFCPEAPELVDAGDGLDFDRSGMIFADLLAEDCGMDHSWVIWYAPDGSLAYLIDQRSHSRQNVVTGTLVEVLTEAVKVVWWQR